MWRKNSVAQSESNTWQQQKLLCQMTSSKSRQQMKTNIFTTAVYAVTQHHKTVMKLYWAVVYFQCPYLWHMNQIHFCFHQENLWSVLLKHNTTLLTLSDFNEECTNIWTKKVCKYWLDDDKFTNKEDKIWKNNQSMEKKTIHINEATVLNVNDSAQLLYSIQQHITLLYSFL